VLLGRLNGAHLAEVFSRIERIDAAIMAQRGDSRAFVKVEGDVRTRPRPAGVAIQHCVYAALREFCNFEIRKTRRLAFNPVHAVELVPAGRRGVAGQRSGLPPGTRDTVEAGPHLAAVQAAGRGGWRAGDHAERRRPAR
jgi:hypothetical protein